MFDARRGTVLWAINHFRKDALQAFVADLQGLEERGLSPHECRKVQDALAAVIRVAAEVPAGTYWELSVYNALERFQDQYVRWNSHASDEPRRRREDLVRLKRRKQAISTRIGQHQRALNELLKIGMVVKMQESLAKVTTELPALFPKLGVAVERFHERLR